MKNIIASLVMNAIFDLAELSDKLDTIASQQDAINARLDELEADAADGRKRGCGMTDEETKVYLEVEV